MSLFHPKKRHLGLTSKELRLIKNALTSDPTVGLQHHQISP